MKLITRNADYAIRAIIYMAGNKNKIIPVPEFVKRISVPRPFFHGTMGIDDCYFKKAICPNIRYCPVKKRIDKVEKFIASELGAVNISELLR